MFSRAFDALLAAIMLLVTAPLLLMIALAIHCDSPGPTFFVQWRLGHGGRPFRMHKFRTLQQGGDGDATITAAGDARITRIGHWLRRLRLDELPQLLDVLSGRMALVGPRPEVPENLEAVSPAERQRLFAVWPGVTGRTQLEFIAEDEVLATVADPVATYRRILVPAKVRNDLAWLPSRSFASDLLVLLRTPVVLLSRRARARSRRLVARLVTCLPT